MVVPIGRKVDGPCECAAALPDAPYWRVCACAERSASAGACSVRRAAAKPQARLARRQAPWRRRDRAPPIGDRNHAAARAAVVRAAGRGEAIYLYFYLYFVACAQMRCVRARCVRQHKKPNPGTRRAAASASACIAAHRYMPPVNEAIDTLTSTAALVFAASICRGLHNVASCLVAGAPLAAPLPAPSLTLSPCPSRLCLQALSCACCARASPRRTPMPGPVPTHCV